MSDDPRIPDKQYFRIGEVARLADVKPHVLRFWESEFGSLRPGKAKSGHRVYSRSDVAMVLRIRDLLYEQGYTIAGARGQLGEAVLTEIPAHTREVLRVVRNEVLELLRLVEE
ncbi:MerR family transcriptional regulator [Haliangium sp.]|uniref:MerR family transcriptional regulator n=1 Tax=Haliangium sp. TaxID=2663208 RepID=UPI003D0F9318